MTEKLLSWMLNLNTCANKHIGVIDTPPVQNQLSSQTAFENSACKIELHNCLRHSCDIDLLILSGFQDF